MNQIWILAQAEAPEGDGTVITSEPVTEQPTVGQDGAPPVDPNGEPAPPPPTFDFIRLLPFLLIFVFIYFLMFRGPKKRQQEHQKMVQGLKPNDRVRTIGGILGTVISVKEDEIVLKIDESNNTKMRVVPGAIHKLASDDSD